MSTEPDPRDVPPWQAQSEPVAKLKLGIEFPYGLYTPKPSPPEGYEWPEQMEERNREALARQYYEEGSDGAEEACHTIDYLHLCGFAVTVEPACVVLRQMRVGSDQPESPLNHRQFTGADFYEALAKAHEAVINAAT